MGVGKHGGTMPGAVTPMCDDCGVALCWDISEAQYRQEKSFWEQWKCRDCNGGEPMSIKQWRAQHVAKPGPDAPPADQVRKPHGKWRCGSACIYGWPIADCKAEQRRLAADTLPSLF